MEIDRIALIVLFLFSLLFIVKLSSSRNSSKKRRRPPGPWGLPFVGSIHHMVTSQPHAALWDLAEKHGPVMYLRLGQIDTVVISSADGAQEVLQTKDVNFRSRPTLIATEVICYGGLDLACAPYGDYWRAVRKLCVVDLLSARKVRQFAPIRDSETMSLVAEIRAAATGGKAVVNIGKLLVSCTYSITGQATFGDGCSHVRKEQFLSAAAVVVSNASGFCIADLFPSLWFVDVLTGMRRRLWRVHRQLDDLFNKVIEECEARWRERKVQSLGENVAAKDQDGLLSILLKIRDEQELGFPFNNANIKAIILVSPTCSA